MTDLYGELSQWLTMTRLINRSPETAIRQEMLGWSGSLESPPLKILKTSKLPDTIAGREQQVLHAFFLTTVYTIYVIIYAYYILLRVNRVTKCGGIKSSFAKGHAFPDDSRHEAPELCEMPHVRLIRLSLLWASLLPERGGYPGAFQIAARPCPNGIWTFRSKHHLNILEI